MKFRPIAIVLAVIMALCTMLTGCDSLLKPQVDFMNEYRYDIVVGESVKLDFDVKHADCENVSYVSSNPKVVTVEEGVATAVAPGVSGVNILVDCGDEKVFTFTSVFYVTSGQTDPAAISGTDFFDVSYETESYMDVGGTVKLNCAYVNPDGSRTEQMTWRSRDEKVATVDGNGNVTGVAPGYTEIIAENEENGKSFEFTVTVLEKNLSAGMKAVIENHTSNADVDYNLNISWDYYYDVVDSVNNMFFTPLETDYRYHDKLGLYEKNDGIMKNVEFITVHYTGNPSNGADADNNVDYFNYLGYTASIHYVTGRSNIDLGYWDEDHYFAFAGLNEKYMGWHATNSTDHVWFPTGVRKQTCDPETPFVSVSCNGKFTINGRETSVAIPEMPEGFEVIGPTYAYVQGSTHDTLTKYGIVCKVVDGEYYIGDSYWNQEYKLLSNTGGNHNSIGIESCVDIGSNLVHTWHITAQLVAQLMLKYDLDISRVVGHNAFSGKNCPQPLIANDMKLWSKFIEYVNIEYDKLTRYKSYDFGMEVKNGDGAADKFGLLSQDGDAHCVTYEVTVKSGARTEKVTLGTIVESNKMRPACAAGCESLQQQGYKII